MILKFKKLHPEAVIPKYAKKGDAGLDLVATSQKEDNNYGYLEYGTGLAVEIPEGFVGLIFPRSSISKTKHSLANAVGVIDSGYRGEIKLRFIHNTVGLTINLGRDVFPERILGVDTMNNQLYNVGDKIGQLVVLPIPNIKTLEVEELSDSDRGDKGFGSTGN